jgi:hypothetical protein
MQDQIRDREETPRLDLAEIPEMARPVGLYGAPRHAEIAGSACFGIVVTLAIYANHG